MKRLPSLFFLIILTCCSQGRITKTESSFAFLPIYPGVPEADVVYLSEESEMIFVKGVVYTAPASLVDVQDFYFRELTRAGWKHTATLPDEQDFHRFFDETILSINGENMRKYEILKISYEQLGSMQTRVEVESGRYCQLKLEGWTAGRMVMLSWSHANTSYRLQTPSLSNRDHRSRRLAVLPLLAEFS